MTGGPDVVLHEYDEVDSTQIVARALIGAGAAHGTAVLARRQSGARGRRGRAWSSTHAGVWLSVILRPRLPLPLAPRLPIAACAVVLDVLRARGLDVWIKWPNDVLVPATTPSSVLGPFRKAGGLLVEVVDVGAGRLESAVLGLGLNLQAPAEGFGAGALDHAGALDAVGFAGGLDDDDLEVARQELGRGLADACARRLVIDSVTDPGFAAALAQLRARSATLGRRVTVDGVAGLAVDLDDDGALVLEDDTGRRHIVTAGDVSLLSGFGSG
jgi:BirA family biotin operon repressor/biotin-[acetyl-CoA-carboxylase] ligase